jgi:hypothetical protein
MRTTITIEGPDLRALERALLALSCSVGFVQRVPQARPFLTAYDHNYGGARVVVRIEEGRQ